MTESERAKAVVLRMVERLWNGHDLDVADDLFLPDFDNGRGNPRGPAFIKEWHRSTRESFPDLRYTIDELLAEGNCVVVRWTATGI
jgi:predicted ester cyclase